MLSVITNHRFARISLLAVVTLFTTASLAKADTVWRTTYRSLGGQVLDAVVTLDSGGNRGRYSTYDRNGNYVGGGSVYNVRYENFGGQPLLRGQWSWNTGGSGRFTWRMNNTLDSFNGDYSASNGGGGFWNGRYDYGSGAVGGGGPAVGF